VVPVQFPAGEAVKICFESVLSGIRAMCPNRDRRLDWTMAERWGCTYLRLKDSNAMVGVLGHAAGKVPEAYDRPTDKQTTAHYSKMCCIKLTVCLSISSVNSYHYIALYDIAISQYK